MTTKLIETSANDLEPSRRRTEAKSQLPQLASVLFETYHERLAWLSRWAIIILFPTCITSDDLILVQSPPMTPNQKERRKYEVIDSSSYALRFWIL